MGVFAWPIRIHGVADRPGLDIDTIVDTGAAFTTVPRRLLEGLGVQATGRRKFLIADGSRVELEYGEARVSVNGETVTTLVVFGENEAPSLLGAYTLEGLALAVDPVEQRLVPTEPIMCSRLAVSRPPISGRLAPPVTVEPALLVDLVA